MTESKSLKSLKASTQASIDSCIESIEKTQIEIDEGNRMILIYKKHLKSAQKQLDELEKA